MHRARTSVAILSSARTMISSSASTSSGSFSRIDQRAIAVLSSPLSEMRTTGISSKHEIEGVAGHALGLDEHVGAAGGGEQRGLDQHGDVAGVDEGRGGGGVV